MAVKVQVSRPPDGGVTEFVFESAPRVGETVTLPPDFTKFEVMSVHHFPTEDIEEAEPTVQIFLQPLSTGKSRT
jgi:hypothetical protein